MAYAATVSLSNTLRRLQLSDDPKSQIDILADRLISLRRFLEDNREVKNAYEIQIRDAIYEAEDIIDSRMFSAQFLSPSEAEISNQSFCQDLERVVQKISSIAEMTAEEFNHQTLDRKISNSIWKKSDEIDCKKHYPLVGRDEDLIQLKDRLMSGSANLQVVPIAGIAGMGKTALANCVLKDQLIGEHFDDRGWVKVSVEYHKRDVVLGLLRSMKKLDHVRQMMDEQLQRRLYNVLKHRRYLVVLDDIRDVASWNDLKELFPNYHNGSRIIITTRNIDVARTGGPPHLLGRLTDENISALLQKIVFDDEPCPPQLAIIAEHIAESCRGFPYVVLILGRLLRCAEVSAEYWEIILSSIDTCCNYEDLIEAVVSLTYNHLPQHLKACLLYMGIFPYDYDVPISRLMTLWTAEGFIVQAHEAQEEMKLPEEYLLQLVWRGLVSLSKPTFGSTIKTCTIYEEVFHDFILRKGREEKFVLVINKDTNYNFLQEENNVYDQQRRLCIHKNIPSVIKDLVENNYSSTSISTVRSLLYTGPQQPYPLEEWLGFKLLKVLDALKIRFYTVPHEILKLIQLRYLALTYNGQLPPELCKLHNLQFLIIFRYLNVKFSGVPSYLPMEIWNMKELRHLQVMGSDLPEPPSDTHLLLENLYRLSDVSGQSCTPQILRRLPNLKQLGIRIEAPSEDEYLNFFSHLYILDQLHTFKCVVMYRDIMSPQIALSSIPAFPSTLTKLTLSGCGFPWEYMRTIAALPCLETLKLRDNAFKGPKWEVKEDEFPRLNLLLFEDVDLENWILVDETCFPMLKYLIIRHCYKLREIPLVFPDSPMLEMLEVVDCCTSAMNSALRIKEENLSRGNHSIEFSLYSSWNE